MAIQSPTTSSAGPRHLHLAVRRQKSGVSLEQVVRTTKISLRFLQAIEAEEFDKLPGGVFNTSYIRQYAAATGCDESELLACYHSRTAAAETMDAGHGGPGRRGPKWAFLRWFRAPSAVGRF